MKLLIEFDRIGRREQVDPLVVEVSQYSQDDHSCLEETETLVEKYARAFLASRAINAWTDSVTLIPGQPLTGEGYLQAGDRPAGRYTLTEVKGE